MRRRWLRAGVVCGLVFAALAPSGCGTGWTGPTAAPFFISVQVLYSGSQCGPAGRGPSAEWVAALDDPRHSRLEKTPGAAAPLASPGAAVLRIRMGECPTAGYRLLLTSARAAVDRGVATIDVEWREPAPGARVAQVVTSPCLVLKFSKTGLERVRVRDQHGRIRFSLAFP